MSMNDVGEPVNIQNIRTQIKSDTLNSDLYLKLGMEYHRLVEYTKAIRSYNKGIDMP